VSCLSGCKPNPLLTSLIEEIAMWSKPEFTDLRIGFEVTMYFSVR
jgi:coenzyme PQQ precursor peptide PqqA